MPICKKILDMISEPMLITVYGPAGSGKTTFALELIRYFCKPRCLYISTTGLGFLERAQVMGIDLSGLEFLTTLDYNDFVRVLTFKKLSGYDIVVFDTISQYASLDEKARLITLLSMAMLRFLVDTYGVYSIAVSHVIFDPRIERERPLLYNALRLWSNLFVELARVDGVRRARLVNPTDETLILEARYTISSEGLVWLDC